MRKIVLLVVCIALIFTMGYSAVPSSSPSALAQEGTLISLHPDNPYMVVNGVEQEIDPG